MKISEVAERSGVPVSTLRYDERLGILAAGRSPNRLIRSEGVVVV